MASRRTAVPFALLALFIAQISGGVETEVKPRLQITDAEIAFIAAREYNNSQWKRIRNSILYAIAPNYLKAVWPFDGYDVETVRNLACEPDSRYAERSLGNKLTFVRAWGDHPVKVPVDGVEVDFKRSPESGPRLKDLCEWLRTPENLDQPSITQIILQYDALNPPGEGRWELVSDKNKVAEDIAAAIPVLEGNVLMSVLASKPYRRWMQSANQPSLGWTGIASKDDLSAYIDTIESLENFQIWRYVPNDQNMTWAYYLTMVDVELEEGQPQKWESPESTFTWASPPDLANSDGASLILWASPITQRHLEDDWFLVTDKGFDDVVPARRFEQVLERKGTIDTDVFIPTYE